MFVVMTFKMIMLVAVCILVFTVDVVMGVDVGMLVGVSGVAMLMGVAMNMNVLMAVLQGDGIFDHENRRHHHNGKSRVKLCSRPFSQHHHAQDHAQKRRN